MKSDKFTYSDYNVLNTAALYAAAADTATIAHGAAAIPVAHHILTHEQPNWAECAMHTAASTLDLVDGKAKNTAVRLASKVLFGIERNLRDPENRPTKEEYARLAINGIVDRPSWDERVDKGYFYTVTSALMARAVKSGHMYTAAGLGANLTIVVGRDTLKTAERKEARIHDISVHATQSGKEKTKLQSIGLGVLCSPLGRIAAGRTLGLGIITYSTGLGVKDLYQYRRFVRHEKARKGESVGLVL